MKTGDQASASALLKANKNLMTIHLWARLMSEAARASDAGDAPGSSFILALARQAAEQTGNKRLLAFTTYRIANAHYVQDDITAAEVEYLLSKKTFEEVKSRRDVIYVLAELGELHTFTPDYKKAEEYSEECLRLAESLENTGEAPGFLPDGYGIATALSTLAKVSMWRGDPAAALAHLQRSLTIWKGLSRGGSQYRVNILNSLADVGRAYRVIGDHRRALDHFYRALEIAKTSADKSHLASVLNSVGILYLEQGDYAKASEPLNESLRLYTELRNRREVARLLLNVGVMNQKQGTHQAASEYFQRSMKEAEEVGEAEIATGAQEGLGAVHYGRGEYPAALECYDKAWSLAQSTGDEVRLAELLWRKGQVFYSQGDYVKSGAAADNAADLAAHLRLPVMSYLVLTLKGKSYRAQKADGAASESFMRAIAAVEQMRDKIAGAEREQQLFFEDKVTPYHEMVALLSHSGRVKALAFRRRL